MEAMNSVSNDLIFENGRLATLDFEYGVIENQITYSYFQKSMTPVVIGEESAMSDHQKFSILCNEVITRMSNIRDRIHLEERINVISIFTREPKNSGYSR